MRYKKFNKSQRGGFRYWFWHWLAFNRTAAQFRAWQPRHILHDIEKPWMMLWYRTLTWMWLIPGDPYLYVQRWHRTHRKHHLEYHDPSRRNWTDMVIDWQCSVLTKSQCIDDAITNARAKLTNNEMTPEEFRRFSKAWADLNRL
jgi:hypothetical protein